MFFRSQYTCALADPGGGILEMRAPLGPISVSFMQFSAKILPNVGCLHQTRKLLSSSPGEILALHLVWMSGRQISLVHTHFNMFVDERTSANESPANDRINFYGNHLNKTRSKTILLHCCSNSDGSKGREVSLWTKFSENLCKGFSQNKKYI